MTFLLVVIWALTMGVMVPFQSIVNARLSQQIGSPINAAFISFAGGFICFLLIQVFGPAPFPTIKQIMSLRPILLSGGLIGALFVGSAILLVPKLGSTAWIALIVTGQLAMSLLLDHYGILGLPVKSINLYRVVGALLLIAGSTMITKF